MRTPSVRQDDPFSLGEIQVPLGQRKDIRLKVSETFTATPVFIPVTVMQGVRPGPRLFVTATIHGDEINGVESIRRLRAMVEPPQLTGALILVPVANPLAFMHMQRDLPDGRDLNRCFPGSRGGSLTGQLAHILFNKIVKHCDFGIDLHTAAEGRTNLPHLRADMRIAGVRRLVSGFGAEFVLDTPGHPKMLRSAAVRRGVPVVVHEGGAPMKFQDGIVGRSLVGIKNVMADLGMYAFRRQSPVFQMVLKDHKWLRARRGGILILKARPGDVVEKGQQIAEIVKPYGTEVSSLRAPYTGVVVGATTHPLAYPGTAVAHLLKLVGRQARYRKLLETYRVAAE